jgi:transcriptional regulator with XRE-family HTH domain
VATFGTSLRRWREQAGLTQGDLAEQLGITQQTVSDWERDRGLPHRTRTAELDRILGLEPRTTLLAIHGALGEDGDLEISATGVDLDELRIRDPEGYEQIMALARHLLHRARSRPDPGLD